MTTKDVHISTADQLTTGSCFFLLYESANPPLQAGGSTVKVAATVTVV
jgi:hypothetical protein